MADEPVKQTENKSALIGFAAHPELINRNGRPKKGHTLSDIMAQVLEEKLPDGHSRKEAFVRKVLELAYQGDVTMIRLAFAYMDGLPKPIEEDPGLKTAVPIDDTRVLKTLLQTAEIAQNAASDHPAPSEPK